MKNTSKSGKNYWPLAIVGLISFGVVMVSISIYISLKNPVQIDTMYGQNKKEVDDNFNALISKQIIFEKDNVARFYTGANLQNNANLQQILKKDSALLLSPYFATPHRDKTEITHNVQNGDDIVLWVDNQTNKALDIMVKSRIVSYHLEDFLIDLGEMTHISNNAFISPNINLETGRYKIIFDISSTEHDLMASFEKELFVK